MAGSPIARLFAQLGFKVDRTGLKAFENDLKSVKHKIDSRDGITGATDNARKKQSKLFTEIKGNYSKVRPSLKQMRHDLKRIDGAMFQNKLTAEEYGEARKRITNQISKIESAAHQKEKARLLKVEKMYDRRNFQLKELRAQSSFIHRQQKAGNITLEERRRILQGIHAEYLRIKSAQTATAGAGRTGQTTRRTGPFAGGADPRQKGSHGIISALHSDVGLGVLAGGFAAAQSVQSYQNYIAMEQGLTAATGSVQKAGKELEYLMDLSNRMGVFVGDLGKSFTGLAAAARGTSLEGQGVRDVFEGVAAQARVLNLSAADTQGVFTAVTQIMNKGTVMAEELKNQLGERLPGSMQAAARAAHKLGVTQDDTTASLFKAMEQSKLASETFLPAFAEELFKTANEGDALARAMQSTGAAIGRFRTNLFLANKTFNESGFDRNVRVLINLFSDFLYQSEGMFQFFGKLSEYAIYPLRAFGEVLRAVGSSIDEYTNTATGSVEKLEAFTAVFLSLFKWGRKLLAVFILIPAAVSGVTKLIEEGQLSWSEWAVTLGSIAGTLLLIMNRMRKIGGLGAIGGAAGAAAGAGAAGAAARGAAKRTPWGMAAWMALGSGEAGGEQSVIDGSQGMTPFTSSASPLRDTPGADPRASQRSWMDKLTSFGQNMMGGASDRWNDVQNYRSQQPWNIQGYQGGGNQSAWGMIVEGGITFEITGDNATEISDEVIRVINEKLIGPASASDPVTER